MTKCHAGICRHVFEELFQGLKTAGRSAQRRDQQLIRTRFALATHRTGRDL
jgi:hypothetical protein